jgi:hypothetical protein
MIKLYIIVSKSKENDLLGNKQESKRLNHSFPFNRIE